jgi:periplasmic divalent cation tolerance protein
MELRALATVAGRRRVDSTAHASIGWRPMQGVVIVTTVGSEDEANRIAEEVVARRQAACVNIVTGVRSVYRWKGEICRDSEYLLIVKSLATEYEAVADTIRELHSYELPEILAFSIHRGDRRFLEWIAESCDKSAGFDDDDLPELVDPDAM